MNFKNGIPQYLLLKRSENRIYPGIWQCVTGKIRAGETPAQTAVRELSEETGLQPNSLWTVDQVNHYYEAEQDRMNLIPIFGAEVLNSEIRLSNEHVDFRWAPVDECVKHLLWDQQKRGLEVFHDMMVSDDKRCTFSKIDISRL